MNPVARKQSHNLRRFQVHIAVVAFLYISAVVLNHFAFQNSRMLSNQLTSTLWTFRLVPEDVSRFDVPWQMPKLPKMNSLKESRNRILYSPLRDLSGDGLGHAMATTNADILAALRMGLTYSHRSPHFGTLVLPRGTRHDNYTLDPPAYISSPIEHLFGWGIGEIARESIQDIICDKSMFHPNGHECRACVQEDLDQVREKRIEEGTPMKIDIERVVEIPNELTFAYPNVMKATKPMQDFLAMHNESNTVFTMPVKFCHGSPTYSRFSFESRAWFFHKYWNAHSKIPINSNSNNRLQNMFRPGPNDGLTRIPRSKRRGTLERFREHELTIAIHARRGDFFRVGREIISTFSFARVVRRMMHEIKNMDDTFSHMPVSVSIYSEGKSKLPNHGGHDVETMTKHYQDYNGAVQNESQVESIFRDHRLDHYGDVFPNGLDIKMRISEDTVQTIHEMVAADIFIGSRSGLSMNIVGSMARGAAQFMSWTDYDEKGWCCRVVFDPSSGRMDNSQVHLFHQYWKHYVMTNKASAKRAVRAYDKHMANSLLNIIRKTETK